MNTLLRSILLALLTVVSLTASPAETTTINGITYEYDFTKKYAIVKGCEKTLTGAVNIPNKVTFTEVRINDEYKDIVADVKEIAWSAFSSCTKITSVTANNIEFIGSAAFRNCTSLEKVALGNKLKTIGSSAFYCCNSLKSINLPDGLTTIGKNTFSGCSSLFSGSTLKIPASVTLLGSGKEDDIVAVFSECGVQEVDYGPSIDIPNAMFRNCTNLKSIKINANVKKIGENAFQGCTALGSASNGSMELPNNCTVIGDGAFYRCTGLKNVTFKNTLKTIGSKAFYNCTSLTGLRFEEGYSDLTFGDEAFAGCSGITSIVFLKTKNITFGKETFRNLTNLERLELAEGIVSLGSGNFNNCSKLTDFKLSGTNTTKGKNPNLPSTITGIDNCFNYCSSLTYVDLPAPGEETFLVKSSFSNCDGIEFVTRDPNSLNYRFDDHSFSNLTKLGKAVVPRPYKPTSSSSKSVSRSAGSILITNGAFNNCPNLESFDSPFTIGTGGAFYNCKKMIFDEYLLPYDEEVPSYAIPGYVKKAILKETVRVLHEYAISNVDEINIPDSLRVMHRGCLNLNSNVTELTLPACLNDIYGYAINGSRNLKELTILNPVPPVFHSETGRNIVWFQSSVTLYVPYGSGEAYRTADGWKDMWFRDIVELEKSGITGVTDDNADISIRRIGSSVVVDNARNSDVTVYSISGYVLYQTRSYDSEEISLPAGMYLIKSGNRVLKFRI